MRFVIGNWKSNQNISESLNWLEKIKKSDLSPAPDLQVILSLPFTDIAQVNEKISELDLPIVTAAQNVSHFGEGSHTGEVTSSMLSELVSYCIVGHSERRREFAETSEVVAAKAASLLNYNITPIVCLDTPYLDDQIESLYENRVDVTKCFFVFEPLSAIGTGIPVDPAFANQISHQISFLLDNKAPILYGGSVTSENVKDFVDANRIDGVLVGRDSLEPSDFVSIINALSNAS